MSNREQAVVFARSIGWASRLPPKLQTDLLAAARLRALPQGTRLFAIGDPPGGFFAIVSGCLAVEAAQTSSPPHKTLLYHPGNWFGEGTVVGLKVRMSGVWATRDSHVLSIELADFRRVATVHPEAWRQVALLALETHARTIGLLQNLMLRNGQQRLRAILARLAGLHEELVPDPASIDATQAEIADIANLSRSVVSRFLQDMERDGTLRLGWGNIEILNAARLLQGIGTTR